MVNLISDMFYFGVYSLEELMYFMFWGSFLDCRLKERRERAILIGLLSCTMFLIHRMDRPQAALAASYVIHSMVTISFSTGNLKKRMLISLKAATMFLFFGIIISAYISSGVAASQYNQFLAVMFMELLLLLIIRKLCLRSKAAAFVHPPSMEYCLYGLQVASMITFVGIYKLILHFSILNSKRLLILSGCFLLFLVYFVLPAVYDKVGYDIQQTYEFVILEIKSAMERTHYDRIMDLKQEYLSILESAATNLNNIRAMALNQNNPNMAKAADCFDEWQLQLSEADFCDDKLMNVMLQESEWLAKRSGIKFQVFAEPDFNSRHINGPYVTVILGHVIRYAIELSATCERKYVVIRLYRANEGKFMVMEVNNSISDKASDTGPGSNCFEIRQQYMKILVEKYEGIMMTQIADQELTSKILFF